MRLKILTPDTDTYREVEDVLRNNQVRIFVASEIHGMLSTESLPENVRSAIVERGATIAEDFQYDIDQ